MMTLTADVETELRRRRAALTLEQKVRLLTGETFWTLYAEPAVGLRAIVVSDGPAGVRGVTWDERATSANVPSPTALAASWDVDRVRRVARLLAFECRRKGVDVLLAPTVNLHRTPFGGRHFECFSEDPLLTSAVGLAYVDGLQSQGVGATVKHFVANDSETERFTLDAVIAERVLRELYLAPFEAIAGRGHAWSVMAAYNGVNGHTMTESPLLRTVLKDEWGFDGAVMSDWFATRSTEGAGNGALDLAMPGPVSPWRDALVNAVLTGTVDEAAVDDKVLRILRLAARVGALDGVPAAGPAVAEGGAATGWTPARLAGELRAAAAAGTVLLRNEPAEPSAEPAGGPAPVLPLDRHGLRRVAVVGPNALRARTLGGGSATVFPPYTVSAAAGLRAALGSAVQVTTALGVRSHTRLPAADLDVLILPDGSDHGVEVRFLDAAGALVGSERRRGGAYNWMGSLSGHDPATVAAIEVHTRLRAAHGAGDYTIGASGVGRFALTLGGERLFDETLVPAPGLDPVEGLSRPPQHAVGVSLADREEIALVLRHDLRSGSADSSFAGLGVVFQLNVEAPHGTDDEEIARAVALAAQADVAVVVVGTTAEVESEGYDRSTLALPGRQDDLVRAVLAANPRTVVVVNAGSPVLLPWAQAVPAVLMTWFPGQEAGNALADVLLGVVEPGGRLPVSWPATPDGLPSPQPVHGTLRYDEGLFVGYRGYDRDGRDPQFAFGHGLGYTTWDYLGAEIVPRLGAGQQVDQAVEVRVALANVGERAGREVVQVYLSRPVSTIERPVRVLAGFTVVQAAPGEQVTATVQVPAQALRHWDDALHAWAVEPGPVEIAAGRSSRDLRVTAATAVG